MTAAQNEPADKLAEWLYERTSMRHSECVVVAIDLLRNGIMPGKEATKTKYLAVYHTGNIAAFDELPVLGTLSECVIIDLTKVPASAYVQPEPVERTVWANIYANGVAALHDTHEKANEKATYGGRIACKQISFREGEGI